MRCLALSIFCLLVAPLRADVTVEKSDLGAVVTIDGQPFTEYLTKSGNKPVLWPIVGPTGKPITRGYPIAPQPGETNDHIHQRGLWFTHGDVNGLMFWNQEKGSGSIRHREFTKLESGKQGTIVASNDWLDADGKKICEEDRTFRFSSDDDARVIDAELTLRASEGELAIGDNKEGSFGLRVADTMRVEANKGGKIVNSAGATNDSTWGRPAKWVDYYGPVGDETLGVAILDHPSNGPRPTRWHVRGYGLFAANPFSQKAFDATQEATRTVIPNGNSNTWKYRVVLHKGDEKTGRIAERWDEY